MPILNRVLYLFFGCWLLIACGNDPLPKPKPYLVLKYPKVNYNQLSTNCPYSFNISSIATIKSLDHCWAKIEYPSLKATIHITYRPINNNLNEILKEVEKLTFEHTIKADAISEQPYNDATNNIYAKLYQVEGNVATNIQFRATDSLKHALAGALYFDVEPNYDSIKPALDYLEKDIMQLVESLAWNNE